MANSEELGNLWLARLLFELGGVEFGDFTLGRSTVHSPIYVNLRRLISHPTALWRVAHIILNETLALASMRRPLIEPYQLVAGVPFGGLLIATAFSLTAKVPMIYLHPPKEAGRDAAIEGIYHPGQTVLIIDDLITGGGSILETAAALEHEGLVVKDAVALLDRQQGGRERLKQRGYNLISILYLEVMLNYLMSSRKIPEDWYRQCMDYLKIAADATD